MVNDSKDVVWREDVPFSGSEQYCRGSWGSNPPKTHNFLAVVGNSRYKIAKRQTAITFEPINGNECNFQDT
jgi:hypothetical protein